MNERAKELGMKNTTFKNCHGLDENGHLTTSYDIALMSRELLSKHPEIKEYTSTWTDTLRDGASELINTNKLILNKSNTKELNTKEYKKERKKSGYDEILSDIQDDSLKELYLEYIKMRKLIKAPMTDRALTMLIKKVNELEPTSIDRQKRMLEVAIIKPPYFPTSGS